MTMVLITKDLNFVISFELVAVIAMIIWTCSICLYFLSARQNVKKLIQFWSENLDNSKLYPEYREKAIEAERQKVYKKCSRILKFYTFPNVLITIIGIARGQLASPSMLGNEITREANRFAILPQSASFFCWFFT